MTEAIQSARNTGLRSGLHADGLDPGGSGEVSWDAVVCAIKVFLNRLMTGLVEPPAAKRIHGRLAGGATQYRRRAE